jgi:hypothetical protein
MNALTLKNKLITGYLLEEHKDVKDSNECKRLCF